MIERSEKPVDTTDREITATRVFDAPRELVWQAMTDPAQVIHWWGPRGFTTTIERMEVRPGGTWKHTMHGPDGTDYPNKSIFTEVVPGERLVFVHGGGKKGGPGANFVGTWTFDALDHNRTRVTVRMVFPSTEERDLIAKEYGAVEGLGQTLDRLGEELAKGGAQSDRDFVISRVFDAPREMVFRAWTEPQQIEKWFGPKGCSVGLLEFDLRPHGLCHYRIRTPDAGEMYGKWVFREIVPPERMVFVNSFSDEKAGITRHPFAADWPLETLTTVTFVEDRGKTTLTLRWRPIRATGNERKVFANNHPSMQNGWTGTLDQLTAYIRTL